MKKMLLISLILTLLVCNCGCEGGYKKGALDHTEVSNDESLVSNNENQVLIDFDKYTANEDIINTKNIFAFQFANVTLSLLSNVDDFMNKLESECELEYTTTYNPEALVRGYFEFIISFRDDSFGDFQYMVRCRTESDDIIPLSECYVENILPYSDSTETAGSFMLPNDVDMRKKLFIFPGGLKIGDSHTEFLDYWTSMKVGVKKGEVNSNYYRGFAYAAILPFKQSDGDSAYITLRCVFDADTGEIKSLGYY